MPEITIQTCRALGWLTLPCLEATRARVAALQAQIGADHGEVVVSSPEGLSCLNAHR